MKRDDLMAGMGTVLARCSWRLVPSVALAGLMVVLGSGCNHSAGEIATAANSSLGEIMAQQTSQLCDNKGSVVLIVGETDVHNLDSAAGQAVEAFRKALAKTVQVTATETVKMPAMQVSGLEPLNAAKFLDLLQKYSAADAIVSFVGVPVLKPAQLAQLPSPRPMVIEAIVFSAPSKAMYSKKLVYLAALPKPGADQSGEKGSSAQERFDNRYELVTAETADVLPY